MEHTIKNNETSDTTNEIQDFVEIVDQERKKFNYNIELTETVLEKSFPSTTPAERLRFLIARRGNVEAASEKIRKFMEWRKQCGIDEYVFKEKLKDAQENDTKRWELACELALSTSSIETERVSLQSKQVTVLPRVIIMTSDIPNSNHPIRTLDGKRIFQVLGAQLDLSLASAQTYAQSIAIYLSINLHRHSMEKMGVIIDVRAGKGWNNPYFTDIMPFAKSLSRLLSDHFPERLGVCLVYNVPYMATALWTCIKPFLDPVTVKKFVLFSGYASIESPPPNSKLKKYFNDSALDIIEKTRKSFFIYDDPEKEDS